MSAFQLDHLQTLLAVVEEASFDAAARRLRVTPSAVSQRIKALEQASGQILLQRTTPVMPTEAGSIVLRLARQVSLLEADARSALHADKGEGWFPLAVAVNADSLATWFLEAVSPLVEAGGVAFDIHREDQEHTTSLLRSGTVMAAVTSTSDAVQGCSVEPLGAMRYLAVCSPRFRSDHAIVPGDGSALARAPRVDFDRRDELQAEFVRRAAGPASVALQPRHFVPTSSDFARAVVLGFGWAMLPEQQCAAEIVSGRLIELAPGSFTEVRLFWQRWNLASTMLDSVTDAVRRGARASLHPFDQS
ncbi:LysR family transcriptional regulator ArgP [Agreia bicolorata]|uniref:Chromosome replication initiation inhibitor protein n=1 Tax=Agreia bicolorata TaxID=110935 RepID=A0ABR5CH49_9MICO|nr:LysR family transcriptional regulator ArgP [Agreia bicolorata]KJC64980.1 chromosome replication initiation inhibitor protein [Agreia bicolorata]